MSRTAGLIVGGGDLQQLITYAQSRCHVDHRPQRQETLSITDYACITGRAHPGLEDALMVSRHACHLGDFKLAAGEVPLLAGVVKI